MSADRVRITCGLGAWHDGHRDRVLAFAVREPDPLRADAAGWRILTGAELSGSLAEMERLAGRVVDSTDDECLNCGGYSGYERFPVRFPHSERCRVFLPLCKCGWPAPTVHVADMVDLLEVAASKAVRGEDGYLDVADLYPLVASIRAEEYPRHFRDPDFRFWHIPSREEQRQAEVNNVTADPIRRDHYDFYVMCDGREGTRSRIWHRRHGTAVAIRMLYAPTARTALLRGIDRPDGAPLVPIEEQRHLIPYDPNMSVMERNRLNAEEADRLVAEGKMTLSEAIALPPAYDRPFEKPLISSPTDMPLIPGAGLDDALQEIWKDVTQWTTTIRPCLCGRDDLPMWRGVYENSRPFQTAIESGIHVLSVEGFRQLLRSTGDLIE